MDVEKVAKKIAQAILADVTDRRGWRQEWDRFDSDIQCEIRETHTDIVRNILKKAVDTKSE